MKGEGRGRGMEEEKEGRREGGEKGGRDGKRKERTFITYKFITPQSSFLIAYI